MSLSAALTAARSSLAANASQTATLSRNIAGAGEELYTRKSTIRRSVEGGVRIDSIGRAARPPLLHAMLGATAQVAGQNAIVEGLEKLWSTVGDPETGQSPAALLGVLRNAIQQHAATPNDPLMARAVLNGAIDVTDSLRSSSQLVQQVRSQADADMSEAVARINTLLSRFETVNTQLVQGTHANDDVTAKMDARDRILASLSEEIGLRVVSRGNNDVALYTDSGVTLFETRARAVAMVPTHVFDATTVGRAVFVDGVPVAGPGATMQVRTGAIAGLAELRDSVAVTYQGQLDEIARGLIKVFAESDQSDPPSLPTVPGLFTHPGAPAIPAAGAATPGLAAGLIVNPNADPDQGGSLDRLRDGGIGEPFEAAYIYNPSGASAYSGRLQEIVDAFTQERVFDPSLGTTSNVDLLGFASASVGWLESLRQRAASDIDYRNALLARSAEALSNATGVNIDEEMTLMLELERSYQASAKLIATVDSMFATLLDAVR